MVKQLLILLSSALLCACGSEDTLLGQGADLPERACGRGLAIVSSDYQSSSVALVDADGIVASPHLISSGSIAPGLSAPLSGDVVVPATRIEGNDAVLLDRYPASVLSWVTLQTAQVRAQLDISTGFAANPQDYLQLSADRAYVTRLDSNPTPGQQPFDRGGDVLLIDTQTPSILERIDLAEAIADAPGFLPRPNAMARLGEQVVVLLSAYDESFADAAPSRLVFLDPEQHAISGVTVLEDLYGCTALAAAPAGSAPRVAVSCSGRFGGSSVPNLDESALVIVDEGGQITQQWPASGLASQPLGLTLDWLDPDRVLVVALGSFETTPVVTDALLAIDIDSGAAQEIYRGQSFPFELGQVRCLHPDTTGEPAAACGECWLADGERTLLQRIRIEEGDAQLAGELHLDDGIGLPPRALGRL